jgi:Fe-S-cluster-containing dehydrogenase component
MSEKGLLIDVEKCIACHACSAACKVKNNTPGEAPWTKVESHEIGEFPNTKEYNLPFNRCMHCETPACDSVCLVHAFQKTSDGSVVYDRKKCIGCRYCMVACPFNVPKFEWGKAVPFINKCNFCADRQAAKLQPACVSVCPTGALLFGERKKLLDIANTRIYQNPDRYVHHIYGEHEAGGTSLLYISTVPFEQLGFKAVGTTPYPQATWSFLSAVPLVLVLWPAFFGGIYAFTKRKEAVAQAKAQEETKKEVRHG